MLMKIYTINEVCNELKEKLSKGFALVCIGSDLRGDDRAALELCRMLTNLNTFKFKIILCEYGIENCIGEIIENKIKRIILIDAAIANNINPASIIKIDIDEIQEYIPYSTHTLPLPLLLRFLIEEFKDLEIAIIGIVVEKMDIELELSPSIKNLITSLANCITEG
jgi:hydrogenase 3 maturation protease